MIEGNESQEFRLKNVDEKKNYFLAEMEQNELINRKCKMDCTTIILNNFLF